MAQVPSPFATGSPTTFLVMVRIGNGAHAIAGADSPLTVRSAALRKPVPVSPWARVQSEEALVAVAGSTATRTETVNVWVVPAPMVAPVTMVVWATPSQSLAGAGAPAAGVTEAVPGTTVAPAPNANASVSPYVVAAEPPLVTDRS